MTPAEVIDAFARAWNTGNDAERWALLSAACVPDAVFVAPQGQTCGVEALGASIAEFRRAFPAAIVSFGAPDGHSGFARVAWNGLVLSGSGTAWTPALAPRPADASSSGTAYLYSVACNSPTVCLAIGEYPDASGAEHALPFTGPN